jgi:hypothetical protein
MSHIVFGQAKMFCHPADYLQYMNENDYHRNSFLGIEGIENSSYIIFVQLSLITEF